MINELTSDLKKVANMEKVIIMQRFFKTGRGQYGEGGEQFLLRHYKTMPRTMLRYAIEKLDKKKREFYLGK